MGVTRVGCAQLAPAIADPHANALVVARAITDALAADVNVIILPELVTTGYHLTLEEASQLAEPVTGPSLAAWSDALAGSTAVVLGGFCERGEDGAVYNSAALVGADGVMAVYRKTHLWDQEFRLFSAGTKAPPVVQTRWGRVGLAICYDLFFPELTRSLALGGAQLLAVPTNSPCGHPRAPASLAPEDGIGHMVARTAAYLNRVFVAVCDRHGDERDRTWTARSSIIDPEGRFVAGPVGYGDALLIAECDLAVAESKRWEGTTNDAFADRRPTLYGAVASTP
jgi:predicted amidohydrolase